MARPKNPQRLIDVAIFVIGEKKDSGVIYGKNIADLLAVEMQNGKVYTIEEVSPVERQLKKKLPYESWQEHAMAESVASRIENNRFIITFAIKNNKYGKLLATTLDTTLSKKIRFFPVGVGEPDENGCMKPSYQLGYIAFEVIS